MVLIVGHNLKLIDAKKKIKIICFILKMDGLQLVIGEGVVHGHTSREMDTSGNTAPFRV